MADDPEYPFDCDGGKINFREFKDWVIFYCGIFKTFPGESMSMLINVIEVPTIAEDGTEEVVEVIRRNGEFFLRWIINIEDFVEFGTLEKFQRSIVENGYGSSRADKYLIEYLYEKNFGQKISEAIIPTHSDPDQDEIHGAEEIWKRTLVRSMAKNLQERAQVLEEASDDEKLIYNRLFDLGFSTGRFLSEYTLKEELEPHVLEGKKSADVIQKRTKASGEKSASQKQQRMRALFKEVALLRHENPAMSKFDKYAVAKIAIENAADKHPDIFKTGKGQYRIYWDYIMSDTDLEKEYFDYKKSLERNNA